jgi:hypothetical protein
VRPRRTFTLEESAHALLGRVGNYSDYVNKLILQHASDWTEALAHLRSRGWHSDEILAACDALSGFALTNASREGSFLVDEIVRIEEVEGNFAKRQVSAQRRQKCFDQLGDDRLLAHSLATLVREYWLFNEDCQQAIRRTDAR